MWYVFSAIQSALCRKRKCRKCGTQQTVSKEDAEKKLKCKKCGADLPPCKLWG